MLTLQPYFFRIFYKLLIFIFLGFPPMSPVFAFEEKTGDSGGFTGFLKYVFLEYFFKIL